MSSRICVVGAGISGLVATKMLSEDGFDVTTFEKEPTIGGVWSPSRAYPDLRANNPRESYAFSDYPYPASVDDFPTAQQVHAYLESYVDHFDLGRSIRLGSEVVNVSRLTTPEREGHHSVFEVTVRPADGSVPSRTLSFDYVVVCNGVFSQPNLPAIRDRARFAGKVLHSSQLGNVDVGPGQRVVVVAAGKSALDCAAMAARRGASSTLVFRRPHWMLPRYMFGRIRVDKVLVNRFSELFVKYHHRSRTEAFLHGPGRWIVRLWWRQNASMIRRMVGMPESFVPEEPLSAGSCTCAGYIHDRPRRDRAHRQRVGSRRRRLRYQAG
jgi:cation diffusion facilitator CzcD-associated flavoprotein CzcO